MENQQKSGFTNTGFSKSSFAACGHWTICNMGKLRCYYEEIDPEVMLYCACYQRNFVRNQELNNKLNYKQQLSLF